MHVVTTLGGLRQEDHEFEIILGYIVRPYLKKQEKEKKTFPSRITVCKYLVQVDNVMVWGRKLLLIY
jgi:hypothetical protein